MLAWFSSLRPGISYMETQLDFLGDLRRTHTCGQLRAADAGSRALLIDAVVGVSRYVADYIRKWSGIPAVHVPISLLDPPPYPDLGRFENEFVTLVNPCAVKGISIFLELADRMPQVR